MRVVIFSSLGWCVFAGLCGVAPACDDASPALERAASTSPVVRFDASLPIEDASDETEPDVPEAERAGASAPEDAATAREDAGGFDAATPRDAEQASVDAAVSDAAASDASVSDAAVSDAALSEAAVSDAASPLSYDRDIAPILERHCQACHLVGGEGPFPLTSFGEVVSHADEIRSVTGDRIMPPCSADAECGLSDAEIDRIASWVLSGTLR